MQPRYSSLNQALHWLTALCMAAILPLAWVMTRADEKTTPHLGSLYNCHKTLGVTVLTLVIVRLVWRVFDPPPAYAQSHATLWLLYATLLWMPVTGFIMSESEGHPTKVFDLIPTPQLWPVNERLADQFGYLHALGQWAIYGLLLLHLAGVAFHLIWAKDGVVGRMLPPYSGEPPAA